MGLDPIVGWKLGCAFGVGGRVLCICAANDRWPLCAQSVRKSEAWKDFELELEMGFDVKEILLFLFLFSFLFLFFFFLEREDSVRCDYD